MTVTAMKTSYYSQSQLEQMILLLLFSMTNFIDVCPYDVYGGSPIESKIYDSIRIGDMQTMEIVYHKR